MPKRSKKNQWGSVVLRISAVGLFTAGFLYQALQFLFLYWTYPTVVDIQMSSPSYVEIPAFTICNRIGYVYDNICSRFGVYDVCSEPVFIAFMNDLLCGSYPGYCADNSTVPPDFKVIYFKKFREMYMIRVEDIPLLAVPLDKYLTCTIEFAGQKESCNMENVMGSFFTRDEFPQFCYTIYSKWGDPNKKRDLIPKGATMKFHMFLNVSGRALDSKYKGPRNNPPCDPAVQLSVHSPYFLPSPFIEGISLMGGRAYELRIKQTESHLLSSPYQTNCTDYMTSWNQRGGKAPIDQMSLIQECRINVTYKAAGCIPTDLDYPHTYNICKNCKEKDINCAYREPMNSCAMLADDYNQPCDSLIYTVEKEDKVITLFYKMDSLWAGDGDGFRITLAELIRYVHPLLLYSPLATVSSSRTMFHVITPDLQYCAPGSTPKERNYDCVPAHDCELVKLWNPECSTIDIDIPFDRFEITNITYNAKYESLEVFSVLGGYMGMWLGISLLTVFDMFRDAMTMVKAFLDKRRKKRSFVTNMGILRSQNYENGRHRMQATVYNI